MRITAPQWCATHCPAFTNNWLVLIKATALVSLIGLQEMTYAAKQASAATRSPFVFFLFYGGPAFALHHGFTLCIASA